MTRVALSTAALTTVYLLVLTSMALGDVLLGAALALAVSVALRPRVRRPGRPFRELAIATIVLLSRTGVEMVRGSWRAARFCLGAEASPGIVEIPRGSRSEVDVAIWGVTTGEAPDEVPVDVDEERDVLLVHLVDASDPEAIRARHARDYERWRRGEER